MNLLRRLLQAPIGLLLNPAEECFESLFAVGHFSGDGGFFSVAKQRNIEGRLAHVNAHGEAGKRSRFRTIGSGHCEIQTNEYRLDDEASQASGAARISTQ